MAGPTSGKTALLSAASGTCTTITQLTLLGSRWAPNTGFSALRPVRPRMALGRGASFWRSTWKDKQRSSVCSRRSILPMCQQSPRRRQAHPPLDSPEAQRAIAVASQWPVPLLPTLSRQPPWSLLPRVPTRQLALAVSTGSCRMRGGADPGHCHAGDREVRRTMRPVQNGGVHTKCCVVGSRRVHGPGLERRGVVCGSMSASLRVYAQVLDGPI
mmetsp:Transcript_100563/g.322804  ORF Transcript_100563/g.322804 Transcript_100563/m.322804 type:complete len:214 (+) Transcript_100563:888-1529(+)